MQLRWTEAAARDLELIADYLVEQAPDRAAALVRTIHDAPTALLTFPNRGRLGKKAGTRELEVVGDKATALKEHVAPDLADCCTK